MPIGLCRINFLSAGTEKRSYCSILMARELAEDDQTIRDVRKLMAENPDAALVFATVAIRRQHTANVAVRFANYSPAHLNLVAQEILRRVIAELNALQVEKPEIQKLVQALTILGNVKLPQKRLLK